jgi:hypothetical protein
MKIMGNQTGPEADEVYGLRKITTRRLEIALRGRITPPMRGSEPLNAPAFLIDQNGGIGATNNLFEF